MSLPQYFSTAVEFVQFKERIKFVPCPWCRRTGFLIRHGKLPGTCVFPDGTCHTRGHRYLCSNRNKRDGCGRTFSILMSYVLKHRTESSLCFWLFLKNIIQGHSITRPFYDKVLPFTLRAAKRWRDKFTRFQSQIRNHLIKLASPPTVNSLSPLIQTIQHIKQCFPEAACPVQAFQYHLQTAFLSAA